MSDHEMGADLPPGSRVIGGEPISDDQRALLEWRKKAITERLSVLRATAQHWQTTTSAITGLFGAATLIGSDTTMSSLKPYWDCGYAVAVAAAIVLSALAIRKAAAAGEASSTRLPAELSRLQTKYDELVSGAEKHISCSRVLTLLAVISIAIASAIRWYAPRLPPQPARLECVKHSASALSPDQPRVALAP